MRITIALPAYWNFPIGGFHVHYQYANLLARRGHDVTIVYPMRVEGAAGPWMRVRGHIWALWKRLRNRPLVGSFPLDPGIRLRLLRDLSPAALPSADLLIATAWRTAEALCDAPPRCGRKFYIVYDYEYWMTSEPALRERMAQTYRMPFGIITTSGIVTDMVRDNGGTPLVQIECGLDFDQFGLDIPADARDPVSVGFPVRGDVFKGFADALAAVGILRDRYGSRLQVTAFGSHRSDMPDWIRWLEYPSQTELRRFYNEQAVFLLPSHFEGWGLTGVEALACGAALVTADNGGSRDYAMNGVTALVVPPRQPALLAAAVERLLDDPALRQRLAAQGHDFVQRYTWQHAVDRLEATLTHGRTTADPVTTAGAGRHP